MKELNVEGMSIAPEVIETVVSIAMNDVEGVTAVGSTPVSGLMAALSGANPAGGIECDTDEEGKLVIGVHISVSYGLPLPEIAASIRTAVFDAVTTQVGAPVARVDVYVDGIEFKN